jgi:methylenetetrahydrofolate reductase (NADPH)
MDKPLHNPSVDLPVANDHDPTNGTNGTSDTNGTNGEKSESRKGENPNLIDAAKAAAVEVTNAIKGLAVSN